MSTNRQSLVRAPRAISNFRATHSEKVLTCEINCGGAHGQTALWGSDLFFSRLDGLFSQNDLNCICGDVACLGLNRGICSFDLWVTVLMVLLRYSSDAREQLSGARWIGAVSFNRVRWYTIVCLGLGQGRGVILVDLLVVRRGPRAEVEEGRALQ